MTTVYKGEITTWKDEKGFGFIKPQAGGREIFFHIRDVTLRGTRSTARLQVSYTLTYDQNQRPRAINVRLVQRQTTLTPLVFASISGFFLLVALLTYLIALPIWILLGYALVSSITFLVYGADKTRATTGTQRVPEFTLHLLELCGGWPGALAAQDYYRHKTRKASYQATYWLIVFGNLLGLALVSIGLKLVA